MGKVICLLGLCGSGKTYQAHQIPNAHVIDENFFARLQELGNTLASGKDCVIAEVTFCLPEERRWLIGTLAEIAPGIQIQWICIENDLAKANRNCHRPRLNHRAQLCS